MSDGTRSNPSRNVPEHLPKRLAIDMPLWLWITDRQPGEEWADLDAYFAKLVDLGHNACRVDAMLNWVYRQDGSVRGPVEVGRVMDPGSKNSGGWRTIGGVDVQALDEVLKLFRAAERHGVFLILTSWEYQPGHTTTLVADKALRDEINGIPADEKLMAHARKFDLLLTQIKQERLDKQIAFVEIHNELSVLTQFFGGPEATKRHTEDALAYLQARHPDILFSGDYVGPWSGDYSFDYKALHAAAKAYAKNTQLVDHHLYAFGVQAEFFRQAGLWTALQHFSSADFDIDGYMARLEQENELFRRLLLPGSPTWREYRHHFKVETPWRPIVYLFENMDNDAYDYWMFRHFHEHEDRMKGYWKNTVQFMGQRGRDTGLPVVCDEGYVFYAPLNSEFEASSAVGRNWHEFIVDQMLEQDYWGIYLPHTFWYTTTDWLRELNRRITA